MKDNSDNFIRKNIDGLDTLPPGISWDKEAVWAKIEQQQKAIKRKSDFRKGAAWTLVAGLVIAGLLCYYAFENSHSEVKEQIEVFHSTKNNAVKKTTETIQQITGKEQQRVTQVPERRMAEKAIPLVIATDTVKTSTITRDTVKLSVQKPDSNTTDKPQTSVSTSRAVDKKLDEDYRFGKVSQMQMILGSEGELRYNNPKSKKKKR